MPRGLVRAGKVVLGDRPAGNLDRINLTLDCLKPWIAYKPWIELLRSRSVSDLISAEVSDRICKHMNQDHADAVLLYAQVFGHASTATAAELLAVDATGMSLTAQVDGNSTLVRVQFEHPLQEAKEAHHVLVDMMKQAQAMQTVEP
jgi:putative heme iron utilization protein